MKSQISFSIIIPTYNRAYCLWKAVLSVLKQTYPYFEIIIIDDASTDDTSKLIAEFKDPRIRYIKNKQNKGASFSRNIGLENAKNKFIAYLDSDNTWYEDFLETYVSSIKKHPDKKVFYAKKNYRLHIIDENNNKKTLRDENSNTNIYFDLKRLFHRKILIDTNTLVHTKNIIKDIGYWDEKIDFWEDWEFTLRIADKLGNVFQNINRVLLDYEQTIDFVNKEKTIQKWEESEKYIFNKYKNNPNLKGQKWFPPELSARSTLSIINFLKSKKSK